MTANQLLTANDLAQFKSELLEELRTMFSKKTAHSNAEFLKSKDVKTCSNVETVLYSTIETPGNFLIQRWAAPTTIQGRTGAIQIFAIRKNF